MRAGRRVSARHVGWGSRSGLQVFGGLARGAFEGATRLGKFMRSALGIQDAGTAAQSDDQLHVHTRTQGKSDECESVCTTDVPSEPRVPETCPDTPHTHSKKDTNSSTKPQRQAQARPLCHLTASARNATLEFLRKGEKAFVRPRVEREAFVGLAVLALEFQHSGRQDHWPGEQLPSARPSSHQKRALRVLGVRCKKFVRSLKTVPRVTAANGRCVDKVRQALEEMYSKEEVKRRDDKQSAAKLASLTVKAERIAIPPRGRIFDGSRFLVPALEAGFRDPETILKRRSASEPVRVPRARFHASKAERRALFEKMDAAGMLEAEYAHNVPRGPAGESLASGMFVVPKDPDVDRLITNRTPANSVEEPMKASRDLFPHASCFCELQLSRNQELEISVMDLPDYYHTLGTSRARALRNQLGGPQEVPDVAELHACRRLVEREGPPPSGARVCLLQASLPMGDVNATDVGQAVHVGLLRAHGAARPEELVSYRAPVPRGPVWQSVMIDDNVIISRRRRRRGAAQRPSDGFGDAAAARGTDLVERSLHAYRSEGLEPKPKKTILYVKECEALGAAIDGASGWVCAKPAHMVLAFATLGAAVEAKGATHETAALGTALLTHILMLRRDALCMVERLYAWTQSLRGAKRRYGRMSHAVADEIQVLALLAPLLGTDIRVCSHPELLCTDARGGAHPRAGVCRAAISAEVSRELWRVRTRKGGAACLDDRALEMLKRLRETFRDAGVPDETVAEVLEAEGEESDEVIATRGWVRDIVGALDFRQGAFGVNYTGRALSEHVNLGEYRALRIGVRHLIREGVYSSRVVVCTDSNVVLGAVTKGRSRSMRLRRLQQSFIAELLWHNVYVGVLPVASADNPADDPSRGAPVRAPASEPQPWALQFLGGDLGQIDARIWEGVRERWLVPPDWKPGPRADDSDDWRLSHAAWEDRRARQRGLRVGKGYSSDYTGDGPPRRVARDRSVDVRAGGIPEARRGRLNRLLDEFKAFGAARGVDVPALLDGTDVRPVVALLRDLGHHWYRADRARGDYAELINAVWHQREDWRNLLSGAWAVDAEWHFHEPTQHHAPLPLFVLRAVVVAAILGGDLRFAGVMMIGFAAALRPGDVLSLTRASLEFDNFEDVLYVILSEEVAAQRARPKTARRGIGRDQHGMLTEPALVAFLKFVFGNDTRSARLWPTPSSFARRWGFYLRDVFGLSVEKSCGFTPSALRAGCATELYKRGMPLDEIAWVLRHTGRENLKSYIQALPLARARARMTEDSTNKCMRYAAVYDVAVAAATHGQLPTPAARVPFRARPRRRVGAGPAASPLAAPSSPTRAPASALDPPPEPPAPPSSAGDDESEEVPEYAAEVGHARHVRDRLAAWSAFYVGGAPREQ